MNELFRFVSVRPPRTANDQDSLRAKKNASQSQRSQPQSRQAGAGRAAKIDGDTVAIKGDGAIQLEREERLADLEHARGLLTELAASLPVHNLDGDEDFHIPGAEVVPSAAPDPYARRAMLKAAGEAGRRRTQKVQTVFSKIGVVSTAAIGASGLSLNEDTLSEAISVLDEKIASLNAAQTRSHVRIERNTSYTFYQGHMIGVGAAGTPGTTIIGLPASQGLLPGINAPRLTLPPDVPSGTGYARILGVGDLMVVREEPKNYQLGQIAHIENIMAREFKDRSHRRTDRTEETVSSVSDRETEKERDLQSTERFRLSQEASEVIKFESRLEAGFNLSASYGMTVTVGADTSTSLAFASDASKKSASDFSREVTERAKNRVVEKVHEERTRKTTSEIEEINKHGFDNRESGNHVAGIYRWVDKVVRARLLNYGTRLMLEFVIPEPAAFFMQALVSAPPQGVTLEKPDDSILSLRADQIADDPDSEFDYRRLATLYKVSNVEPAPLRYMQQADNFAIPDTGADQSTSISKKIKITEGYRATSVVFTRSRAWSTDNMRIHVAAAQGAGPMDSYKRTFNLRGAGAGFGELPISVTYGGRYAISVHITAYCERTPQHYAKWQIATYKALLEGYQKMKSKFDEQVAIAGIRQANQAQGFTLERNRAIERIEIRRNVISMLTAQHFDLFGAIRNRRFDYLELVAGEPVPASQTFPELDFDQAIPEGRYIQFFENAFEWTNMSYVFYPYFWGRKQTWVEKIGLDNTDPDHLAFLQAGAVRVIAPVRPGYEAVVIHYLDSGEIWGGDNVPTLDSVSLPYLDIATEIREQQGKPAEAPVVVEEWDVKLPTSLVMLQSDAVLPVFIDEAGSIEEDG